MSNLFKFCLIILLSLVYFNLVYALDTSQIPDNPDDAQQIASNYLKQEWTKILEKNQIGKFLLGISEIFKSLSPLFKWVIGIEYSLSWMFFLSLGVWMFAFVLIYQTIKDINIFSDKKWATLLISAIIPTISSQFGIIQNVLNFFAPFFNNPFIILIAILISILILVIYLIILKYFKKRIKAEKEKRREEKAELVEKLHDIEIKAVGGDDEGLTGEI